MVSKNLTHEPTKTTHSFVFGGWGVRTSTVGTIPVVSYDCAIFGHPTLARLARETVSLFFLVADITDNTSASTQANQSTYVGTTISTS